MTDMVCLESRVCHAPDDRVGSLAVLNIDPPAPSESGLLEFWVDLPKGKPVPGREWLLQAFTEMLDLYLDGE